MKRFPNTVDDLIAELDRQYPEVIARPGESPEEIMHRALQRGVVTKLKEWRQRALRQPADEREPREKRGQGRRVPR